MWSIRFMYLCYVANNLLIPIYISSIPNVMHINNTYIPHIVLYGAAYKVPSSH